MASNGWPGPMCLFENGQDGRLSVLRPTINELRKITDPVVVVGVAGLYRTGKSYLMNKLAGRQSGFDLGSTVQSKTKGIWVWCVPHPTKKNTSLVLLDTEGLADVEKGDNTNDAQIFSLVVLLSSTLVYNSMGTIDQGAMDKLHFVTNIAEHIKIRSGGGDDESADYNRVFPSFIWAVRDFTLDLVIDERKVSSDEYLEHALKLKTGAGPKVATFNMPRECLRSYFPERKCFVFPRPVMDSRDLSRLDNLPDKDLVPDFIQVTKSFLQHVYHSSKVKTVGTREINGQVLAGLSECYVDAIRNGAVPCIENAVETTAKLENTRAIDECVALYCRLLSQAVTLPTDTVQQLTDARHICEQQACQHFLKISVFDTEKKYYKILVEQLDTKHEEFCKQNEVVSRERCESVLKTLYQPIDQHLKSGTYACPGGYEHYSHDMDELVDQYKATPGKGIKADEVLVMFTKHNEATRASILNADKKLSEEAKKVEAERQQAQAARMQAKAAEEAKRQAEEQQAAQAKSYADHVIRLQEQAAKDMQALRSEMQDSLERQLKEQQRLLEEGHKQRAEAMGEQIAAMRQQAQDAQEASRRMQESVQRQMAQQNQLMKENLTRTQEAMDAQMEALRHEVENMKQPASNPVLDIFGTVVSLVVPGIMGKLLGGAATQLSSKK